MSEQAGGRVTINIPDEATVIEAAARRCYDAAVKSIDERFGGPLGQPSWEGTTEYIHGHWRAIARAALSGD